jgi:DNA-binding Lrp family transcriptional regulator
MFLLMIGCGETYLCVSCPVVVFQPFYTAAVSSILLLLEFCMSGHKLDDIDRKIMAELQADGRMTNVELAKRVGISAPPCLRRVRTLEETGYITGYNAVVDAQSLNFDVQVFAMVGLQSQAESDLSAFEAQCRDWPLVRECHMLNGEVDFILKCVSPDLPAFQSFLTTQLLTTPNVASVKTSLVIRCAKDEPGVPFDLLEAVEPEGT